MWKDLSMQQRADLMDIYLSYGVTSLDEMRNHYDSRNQYSEGGSIHIKPENRGKFTRLKERTGHSASWFKAHGTPAQKKMATFALNAKKWKHGYGGNLYDGTSQPTQQMNNGKVLVTNSYGDNYYIDPRQVNSTEWNLTTPEVSVTANPDDVARGRAERWFKDFGTESNDATSVAGGRRQNSHLDEWGIEGAAKAAAWAKDHPVLNNVGLGLSTIPLAVAATPAVIGGGEFAATALANPYVDAALTSMGGAHAAKSLANGEADWMTALELAPLGRLAKPIWNTGKDNVRAFYNNLTMDLTSTPGTYYVGYPKRDISTIMPGKTGGIFLTPDKKFARGYTGAFGTGKVYETKVNFGENPIHIDAKGNTFDSIAEQDLLEAFDTTVEEMRELGLKPFYTKKGLFSKKPPQRYYHIDEISTFGKKKGASSLIVDNVYDEGPGILGFGTKGVGQQVIVYSPEQISLLKGSHSMKSTPQITAENAAGIQRQMGETAPSVSTEETANAVERGRNTLLDWIRSPFYKARLDDEPLYRFADDVVADAGKMIEEVPIDISKTKLELDPSGMVNGVTKTRPAIQTQLPDGTTVADLNTGLDVNVASDLGKEADETALHELLHYMTANSKGSPISKAGEKIIEKGWMNPTETHFDTINIIHKNRSKGWQDYILDQNDALLPQYDSVVKMVMEEPNKAISFLKKAGKSTQEAEKSIQSLRARYSEWYDIQEQRAYLQQLFHSKIKPNLKNPNDAAEIEEYLSSHPEVLENFPAYKHIQEVRPGSIKDYAKYFSAALGTIPFISKSSKDE